VHQVGFSLHDYIDTNGQQNIKKNAENCVYCSIPKVSWPKAIHTGNPRGLETCPSLPIHLSVQSFKNNVKRHLKKILMLYFLCTTQPLTFWSFHPWKIAQQMDWETRHGLLTQFRSEYPVPSNPWRQQNFNEQTLQLQFYQPQTITREMKLITKQLFQNRSRYLAFSAKCFNMFGRMIEWMIEWMNEWMNKRKKERKNEWMNEWIHVCMYVLVCTYEWTTQQSHF